MIATMARGSCDSPGIDADAAEDLAAEAEAARPRAVPDAAPLLSLSRMSAPSASAYLRNQSTSQSRAERKVRRAAERAGKAERCRKQQQQRCANTGIQACTNSRQQDEAATATPVARYSQGRGSRKPATMAPTKQRGSKAHTEAGRRCSGQAHTKQRTGPPIQERRRPYARRAARRRTWCRSGNRDTKQCTPQQ